MRKWALILAVGGFLGAAIFYSPYVGIDGQTQGVCPVCPHVLMRGSVVGKFIWLTLVGGMINATLFVVVGLSIRAALRHVLGGRGAETVRNS